MASSLREGGGGGRELVGKLTHPVITHTHTHTHTCTHPPPHTNTPPKHVHTHPYTHAHTHTHAHKHRCTLSLSLSLSHTHAHTHTHNQPGVFLEYLLRDAVFTEVQHGSRAGEELGRPPPGRPLPEQLLRAPGVDVEHTRHRQL